MSARFTVKPTHVLPDSDNAWSWNSTPSQSLSRRSSQNFDTSRDIFPKVEEHPVSLQDLDSNPPRPKRALPRGRWSNAMRRKYEPASQFVKRQRTLRHSDVGSSTQLDVDFEGEDEDEDDE